MGIGKTKNTILGSFAARVSRQHAFVALDYSPAAAGVSLQSYVSMSGKILYSIIFIFVCVRGG